MSRPRFPALPALLLLAVLQSGCTWFKKKPAPAPSPPPPPAPVQVVVPRAKPPQAKPIEEPQLPAKPLPPQEPEPNVIRPKLDPAPAPKQVPAATKRPRPAITKPTKPVETPAPPPPKPEPVPAPPATEAPPAPKPEPKLAEVIPEAQRRVYLQSIEDNLESARRGLSALQGRTLNREQLETEGRIRAFIKQAEDARATDVTIAVQLSRRAALLAKDLLESLK